MQEDVRRGQSAKCAMRGIQFHCMATNQKRTSENETIKT